MDKEEFSLSGCASGVLMTGIAVVLFATGPGMVMGVKPFIDTLLDQMEAAAGPLFFFIGFLILLAMGYWAAGYAMDRAQASAQKITTIIARKKKKREYDAFYDAQIATSEAAPDDDLIAYYVDPISQESIK